ncbi:MAG: OmpA family protein, partial [Deltaproteobacteria bacterium]
GCPDKPEDIDGFEDNDGCPELDNDKDGIADDDDQCPQEPEDKDGFEDDDGCPDPDNDGDGLPDLGDLCPNHPEDKDGVKDDDGCPEDDDNDGIPDEADSCPKQPETYNNVRDEDGCPDRGVIKQLVVVTEEQIEVKENVSFVGRSARLTPRSLILLDQVASVLKNYKHLTKVRIEAHTTNLATGRANVVRTYLLAKGIDKDRLDVAGAGPASRAKTKGIAFVIVAQRPIGQEARPRVAPAKKEVDIELPATLKGADSAAPAPLLEVGQPQKAPVPARRRRKSANKKPSSVQFNF